MYLSKRDVIATGLVVVAGLLCLLWATGSTLPGMSSARPSPGSEVGSDPRTSEPGGGGSYR